MANKIKLTLPTLVPAADLLNTDMYGAGAVIRTQSSATETGTYADITGSTVTRAIVSGTETYSAYDPLGTSGSWYRTRIENSGATRVSDWSPAEATVYS